MEELQRRLDAAIQKSKEEMAKLDQIERDRGIASPEYAAQVKVSQAAFAEVLAVRAEIAEVLPAPAPR